MTKKKVKEIANKMLEAKRLVEETNNEIENCNKSSFFWHILNKEDFILVCRKLDIEFTFTEYEDCDSKRIHYISFYKDLEIVCVEFVKKD